MSNKLNHIAVSLTQLAGYLLAMGHVPDVSVVGDDAEPALLRELFGFKVRNLSMKRNPTPFRLYSL